MRGLSEEDFILIKRALLELRSRSENLIPRIDKILSSINCDSCKGVGFFPVLNEEEKGSHIERCDSCKVYPNDHEAEKAAIQSGYTFINGFWRKD